MMLAGGDIRLPRQPPMVDFLNKRIVSLKDADPESVVIAAGLAKDHVLDTAEAQIRTGFPGQEVPGLLRDCKTLPPLAVVTYVFMLKQLPFPIAFTRRGGIRFDSNEGNASDTRVASFGLHQYVASDAGKVEQAKQVRIIWHKFEESSPPSQNFREQFVVELETVSKDDRLILAKIAPEKTLAEAIRKVMTLLATPNTLTSPPKEERPKLSEEEFRNLSKEERLKLLMKSYYEPTSCCAVLQDLESLDVPVLDFDVTREYRELYRQPVSCPNPKINGMPFVLAAQQIRFRLDEKGAALKSDVRYSIFGPASRHFEFNEPFLILLMRKSASNPYFALWIGNAELLVPLKQE